MEVMEFPFPHELDLLLPHLTNAESESKTAINKIFLLAEGKQH